MLALVQEFLVDAAAPHLERITSLLTQISSSTSHGLTALVAAKVLHVPGFSFRLGKLFVKDGLVAGTTPTVYHEHRTPRLERVY